MIEPSIDSLQEKIKSKYSLVTLSARRARQLRDNHPDLLEQTNEKSFVSIALKEIEEGKLTLNEEE